MLPKEIHSRLVRGLSAPPSSPTNSQDLPQAFPFSCCQAKSLLRLPVKWWHCLDLSFTAHADKQWGSEMFSHTSAHVNVFVHPQTDADVALDAAFTCTDCTWAR